ncbi:MAG: hypothetical protein N3I35_06725 [Clostridia bacterium]|nr:hypothetical protein [Clostridia bacterium]
MNVNIKGNSISYIIPYFQLTDWASFTNQPSNDGVEIVSSSANDTQKITIFGTTNGTSNVVYETVTLTGTTAVATTKTDWGNIYGAFLGDIYGLNSTPAVGTITIREASGDQAITTIAATKRSKGMVNLYLPGRTIDIHNVSGNTWLIDNVANTTTTVATATNGFQYTAGMADEIKINKYLSLIGDSTGSTVQIKVLEE